MPLLLYIASVRVLYQGNRKQSWDNDTYFRDVFIYFILNMLIHNELFCVAYNYCSICLSVFYCFSCTFSLSRCIFLVIYHIPVLCKSPSIWIWFLLSKSQVAFSIHNGNELQGLCWGLFRSHICSIDLGHSHSQCLFIICVIYSASIFILKVSKKSSPVVSSLYWTWSVMVREASDKGIWANCNQLLGPNATFL